MKKFNINDSEGGHFPGLLPENWHEVPLAKYAALAAATDWPTRARALAALCGLPDEPLLADVSLCVALLHAAPFLLNGPLPTATATPPASFQHLGVTYVPAPANLEYVSAGQMEGLTSFLNEHEGNPLAAAPYLLAVLYKPEGRELSRPVVEASAAAFASLPMARGYGLLLDFYQRSAPMATNIQKFFAVRPVAEQVLNALETLSRPLASPARSWSTGRWLLKAYLKRATRTLKACLQPSASTAPLPPNRNGAAKLKIK